MFPSVLKKYAPLKKLTLPRIHHIVFQCLKLLSWEHHNYITWLSLTVAHRQSLAGVLSCHELNLDSNVPHWALATAEVQTLWVNIEQVPTMTRQTIRKSKKMTHTEWQKKKKKKQNHEGVNGTLLFGCWSYLNDSYKFIQ